MKINVFSSAQQLGQAAAHQAEELIASIIAKQGYANIILATGASQFDMLAQLTQSEKVDWSKVQMFHLDEYIGLSANHPASFRKYLKERFEDQVKDLEKAHYIAGDANDLKTEIDRINNLITSHPIDVAMIGIGENGHLAFNDPPADFETTQPYILVALDEPCRRQQFGEGWFPSLEAVPQIAISMSIQQIMKSKNLIVSVPDHRKAKAVQTAVNGSLTNVCPASILRKHPKCFLYLDEQSASLL